MYMVLAFLLGALVLLLLLGLLPVVFYLMGLTEKGEALALPDGSVRAVIAIALIALFTAAPIYLFNSISGTSLEIRDIADITQFQKDNPGLSNVLFKKDGDKYVAYYHEAPDIAGIDFAKQMLVLLGTLATSVASFYFGATVAGSAAVQGARAATQPAGKPVLGSLKTDPPQPLTRATDGSIKFTLQLTGSALNNVKTIKLSSGPTDVFRFAAQSSDNSASCAVDCKPTVPAGSAWDVVVIDGTGTESDALSGVLKF